MEGTATNQKRKRDKNSDRLSNLPDSLLLEILSRLNAREVAQTCILSKKWLKIWSFVPSLCFDIADFLDRDARGISNSALEKFRKFVTSFLFRRNETSGIHAFRLLCNTSELECYQGDDFESGETVALAREWVLYALKRNPKILKVSLSGYYPLNLPNCFFTCETLEDVHLCFPSWDNEDMKPKTVCLPRLRNLDLSYANFSDDYLETFLLGCPALESLSMEDCKVYNFSSHTVKRLRLLRFTIGVTISVPAVEILDIDGEDMETMITLKDASKVTRATFSSCAFAPGIEYRCNLLSSLSNVEHLLIDTAYLNGMVERQLPKCPTFIRLRNLTLAGFCMVCVLDAVSSFLDHCPKLEKLTLLHTESNSFCEVGGNHSEEEFDENVEQIKDFPCGLGMVEIRYPYYTADRTVHKLVQLILQRTRKIKGVQVILTKEHVEYDEEDDEEND